MQKPRFYHGRQKRGPSVSADLVKCPREQMTQIVREHLAAVHARRVAQGFHGCPDLLPVQSFAASREEYLTGGDFSFSGILYFLTKTACSRYQWVSVFNWSKELENAPPFEQKHEG